MDEDEDSGDGAEEDAPEASDNDTDNAATSPSWFSRPERVLAERIAQQIRHWHLHGYPLLKGVKPGDPPRRGDAGDVMVLVRKRRELAGLIVARLHAAGVPVAGVDRLRLAAPLAVRDLIAALRFAAQPFDDLNLACLLVSPLIGWSQEQLLAHGWRAPEARKGVSLWAHLRRSRDPEVVHVLDQLGALLARADYQPVPALLHWLLVGPWRARAALVARLGHEANDPIDELLNAARAHARAATPSLEGFLAWFDADASEGEGGGGELKREGSRAEGAVRVLTVHGAKGLQAPIVILADATGDPDTVRRNGLLLPDPAATLAGGEPVRVPLPGLARDEAVGPVATTAAAAARAEAEEHWRLFYVAVTRAEEALFLTGALGAREKAPAAGSWFARAAELWGEGDWLADPIWGARLQHGAPPPRPAWPAETRTLGIAPALPGWLTRDAPEEATPRRVLAPSALGEDDPTDPPLAATGSAAQDRAAAARRGVLIHRLLERLPAIAPATREAAAHTWLARQAAELDEDARAEMVRAALAVIADPRWAVVFSPDALAEVPIAAMVAGQPIVGSIDRLLVTDTEVLIVDFKTTRRPATTFAQVPVAILRQMAAYAAALAATYPGRAVHAAVLYTATPALITLPAAILQQYLPA